MNCTNWTGPIGDMKCDLLAVAVRGEEEWHGVLNSLDSALGGLLATSASEEGFKGKSDTEVVIHTHGKIGATRIALLGVGDDVSAAGMRNYGAHTAKLAKKMKLKHIGLVAPTAGSGTTALSTRFAVEGVVLGAYEFDRHKTLDRVEWALESFQYAFVADDAVQSNTGEDLDAAAELGARVAEGICLARDLVNEGPNKMSPIELADAAELIAKEEGLECTIFGLKEIRERNMQLIQAVNAGSDIEPRLIHLVYKPEGNTEGLPVIGFVGKGLTFDAGGYNLKPTGAIDDMKLDMAGSAAVLGAMKAIQAVKPNVVVHAIVPSTENLVNGKAYKLGDVYTAQNGKTVEIRNTDAEGRLILADALCYANEQGVEEMFSLATLTGACVVALGPYTCGIFGSEKDMIDDVLSVGEDIGEDMWHLPMNPKLRKMLRSPVADMKNVGERWGGASTAALFLKEFVGETKWVHMDLAGPSFLDSPAEAHTPKGGTGYGVLTLLEYAKRKGEA